MRLKIVKILLMLVITLGMSTASFAAKKPKGKTITKTVSAPGEPTKKVIYAENQTLDFEGLSLEGELKAPGEFYFQNRNQERFDSLTKRRVHFRREMLRDSVQSN